MFRVVQKFFSISCSYLSTSLSPRPKIYLDMEQPDPTKPPLVQKKSIRKRIIKQFSKKKFSFGGRQKEASFKRKLESNPNPPAEEGTWVKVCTDTLISVSTRPRSHIDIIPLPDFPFSVSETRCWLQCRLLSEHLDRTVHMD
jgi:hypothetical protein